MVTSQTRRPWMYGGGTIVAILAVGMLGPFISGCDPATPSSMDVSAARPTQTYGATQGMRSPRFDSMLPRRHQGSAQPHPEVGPVGTNAWRLRRPAVNRQIEGYADRVSGVPGTRVGLRVSTRSRAYRVTAYRIGAYAGGSGLPLWTSAWLPGHRQPGPRFSSMRSRTVRAPWRTSVWVDTDGWPAGFYVFQLVASDRWDALVPYVVRSPSLVGKVVLSAPVATWQAYNDWGGYSLYQGRRGDRRAWAVSFDRPYPAPGAGEMLFGVVPVAMLAERMGVPLGYVANTDLDADVTGNPDALATARAFVSLGHDEYWSAGMRATVTRARDTGVNLAFLGANTMYWQIRLAGLTPQGPRTVVGYRTDAAVDPARTSEPSQATRLWRDSSRFPPENAVTGMQYECFPVDAPYRVVTPRWWGFAGTNVKAGTEFPHLVGVEADRVYPIPSTPRPLEVLSHATYSCLGVRTSAESTYYTTRSGAGAFNAGTLRWSCAVRGYCHPYRMSPSTVRFTRQVTRNVLRLFATGPAARRNPSVDNLGRFDLSRVNVVPAS